MNARRPALLPAAAALLGGLALFLPLGHDPGGQAVHWSDHRLEFALAGVGVLAALWTCLRPPRSTATVLGLSLVSLVAALAPLLLLGRAVGATLDSASWRGGFWCEALSLALLAAASLRRMAALDLLAAAPSSAAGARWGSAAARSGTPLLFGAWVLVFWQLLTQALEVPRVLLPSPSWVWQALQSGWGVLASDFSQTVLHSVLAGLAAGCGLGFVVGVLIDRSSFLQRGLLPLAAMASTVPLVGVAPIMVMWFGFDWPSKAAVVVVMTFFPMLVNTLAGLHESGHMERDLMRSYGAGYWRTLASLRIPVALPFVFNALKINSTLAMIGAIVAEFFGSPTAGLGFRISTEAARLNMGLVWAAILVAAVAGSMLYGVLGWIERRVTFWHPSIRTLS